MESRATGDEVVELRKMLSQRGVTQRSGLRCYVRCQVVSELSVVLWIARRAGPVVSGRGLQAYPVASPVADSVPVCTSEISLRRSFLPNLEGGRNRGSPLTYVPVED